MGIRAVSDNVYHEVTFLQPVAASIVLSLSLRYHLLPAHEPVLMLPKVGLEGKNHLRWHARSWSNGTLKEEHA